MSTTTVVTATTGAWTQAASGSANVVTQCQSYPYRVAVASSEPASLLIGVTIGLDDDGIFTGSGLAAGDKVYVTPVFDNISPAIVVMAS